MPLDARQQAGRDRCHMRVRHRHPEPLSRLRHLHLVDRKALQVRVLQSDKRALRANSRAHRLLEFGPMRDGKVQLQRSFPDAREVEHVQMRADQHGESAQVPFRLLLAALADVASESSAALELVGLALRLRREDHRLLANRALLVLRLPLGMPSLLGDRFGHRALRSERWCRGNRRGLNSSGGRKSCRRCCHWRDSSWR